MNDRNSGIPNFVLKFISVCLLFLPYYSAFAGIFGNSNIYECLLDKLPGVKNDAAAIELYRVCRNEFPFDNSYVEKSQSFFGSKTAGECVLKYAENVTSQKAAQWIQVSCYKLFDR
jgi:hypothetical protein